MRLRTRILLSVGIGFGVTVAVAWVVAIWPVDRTYPEASYIVATRGGKLREWYVHNHAHYFVRHCAGEVRASQDWPSSINWIEPPERISEEQFRASVPRQFSVAVPGGHPLFAEKDADGRTLNMAIDYASGWPLLCLRLEQTFYFCDDPDDEPVEYVGAFVLPHIGSFRRHLPWIPMGRGLSINTVLYGVIAYGLLFVPGHMRRALRRRRGLCPACAYPVTEGTCPECGRVGGVNRERR